MDAWDDTACPWLPATRALLARAVAARVPTLGVCLGAQLLALAGGGEVRRGRAGPEFGVRTIRLLPAAVTDPLLSGLSPEVPVVQWHSDEVARTPLGACRLAAADPYEQAFRVGTNAWGLQFHVETPVEMVRRWATADEGALRAAGLEPLVVVDGVAAVDLAETWGPVARRFAGMVLRQAP
jgi:GMP synthase-like glutamine amidotransferase